MAKTTRQLITFSADAIAAADKLRKKSSAAPEQKAVEQPSNNEASSSSSAVSAPNNQNQADADEAAAKEVGTAYDLYRNQYCFFLNTQTLGSYIPENSNTEVDGNKGKQSEEPKPEVVRIQLLDALSAELGKINIPHKLIAFARGNTHQDSYAGTIYAYVNACFQEAKLCPTSEKYPNNTTDKYFAVTTLADGSYEFITTLRYKVLFKTANGLPPQDENAKPIATDVWINGVTHVSLEADRPVANVTKFSFITNSDFIKDVLLTGTDPTLVTVDDLSAETTTSLFNIESQPPSVKDAKTNLNKFNDAQQVFNSVKLANQQIANNIIGKLSFLVATSKEAKTLCTLLVDKKNLRKNLSYLIAEQNKTTGKDSGYMQRLFERVVEQIPVNILNPIYNDLLDHFSEAVSVEHLLKLDKGKGLQNKETDEIFSFIREFKGEIEFLRHSTDPHPKNKALRNQNYISTLTKLVLHHTTVNKDLVPDVHKDYKAHCYKIMESHSADIEPSRLAYMLKRFATTFLYEHFSLIKKAVDRVSSYEKMKELLKPVVPTNANQAAGQVAAPAGRQNHALGELQLNEYDDDEVHTQHEQNNAPAVGDDSTSASEVGNLADPADSSGSSSPRSATDADDVQTGNQGRQSPSFGNKS